MNKLIQAKLESELAHYEEQYNYRTMLAKRNIRLAKEMKEQFERVRKELRNNGK